MTARWQGRVFRQQSSGKIEFVTSLRSYEALPTSVKL